MFMVYRCLGINETVYVKDEVALIWTVTGTNKAPGEITTLLMSLPYFVSLYPVIYYKCEADQRHDKS
jgi:hypothetical protein